MNWLSGGACSAAYSFGWLIGNASGRYALIVVSILIATAPAYHPDVPRVVSDSTCSQRILILVPPLLFVIWLRFMSAANSSPATSLPSASGPLS